ncbi:unnamed protein product [Mytilus coruscus]|uniref:Uncharacterized protein n=1 Tax=Mytilus coruscus TaxID=42192 RepID=A0A6J8CAM4_MYTCO|nr:unnamed protein product [Mytilus coruscus]
MLAISEASRIKWEIKTKPLIIGKEARLSCNANTCPPEKTRIWLGGKNYDLLCLENESKDPLKYEMTSNDPPRLHEYSLKQNGDKFHIELLMKVYPAPNCILLFQKKLLSVNISVRSIPDDGYFDMFEVAIQQTVEPQWIICKGNITLRCEVGTNEYSLHLHRLDLCKEEEKPKGLLYLIIGVVIGIFSSVSFLFCINVINVKQMKPSIECGKKNNPDQTYPCIVQLMNKQHNTEATDGGTP